MERSVSVLGFGILGTPHHLQVMHTFSQRLVVAVFASFLPVLAFAGNSLTTEGLSLTQPVPGFPDLFRYTDTCNAYLIRDGETGLLINVGDAGVLKELEDIGVKRVDSILLTSHHREILQGIDDLNTTEVHVLTTSVESEILSQPTSFRKWFPNLKDKFSVYGASYVRPPAQSISVSRELADGEVFEWNDYSIKCLHTPGHSPGGCTYLVEHQGKTIAFTGGIIHDGARMSNWYDSEWDYGFAEGIDALVESVERLIEEEVEIALPVQGPAIHQAVDQLDEYHSKLVQFRKNYLRGYPVFDKNIAGRDPISVPTTVKHINRVTPHLYKLSNEDQFISRNFSIIVSDRGHGLILDCGLFPKQTLNEIILGMQQHLGLKVIDAFWVSHMHGDHFLLGPTLRNEHRAESWTLDRIVDPCENPRNYDYAALVSSYGGGFDGMKIDRPFPDGGTIEWEGYTIHIDWMPGQTEFGCCLWLDIDGKRVAFTGDNIFGSPSDPDQNGHDAIVCRNSAILEEGYVYGSKYLVDLKPDIVMGSHSYVMPNPSAFLQRYHEWSKSILKQYKELLPGEDYEYSFDPYWVSAYPYRVDLSQNEEQEVQVTVRNFRSRPQEHHVELKLPPGVSADPPVLSGVVPAESERQFPVKLTVDRTLTAPQGNQGNLAIATFDITLDGKREGELFDFIVKLSGK
ncbi:MBL fold metallo-hydrolase [Calycomorphotria hydatis]|uniref:Hydroxyacylglutathione hydrolase n=1 Tax=Calycomorphotria hydatis TaxID=2528027 RepID=A0A517T930_9PLAN|nr:MBL fold metallo-hydrolase [Calycomorphotria hydatis]QDT64891.1 Hydroxyacylglutathione hydrolase [Calycomorphotria hydatis]